MPIINTYAEDGQLIESVNEPLTKKNIKQFIDQHGEEKAKLYLEILKEFVGEIESIVYTPHRLPEYPDYRFQNTLHMTRKQLGEFYEHKVELLKTMDETLGFEHSDKNDHLKS